MSKTAFIYDMKYKRLLKISKSPSFLLFGARSTREEDYTEENHRQIWHAFLWAFDSSGKPGAIISHESALYIHDLSDLLPSKVHITPIQEGRFRRRSMPPTEIEIHKSEVTDADYEEMESGLLVMTPIAALRDLLKEDRQS